MRKVQKNGRRMVALVLSLLIVFTSCMTEELMVQAAPKKPVKITLDRKQASMSVGDTMKLKVKSVSPKGVSKSVKWKSSNKKIATVSGSGKVKAKKNGTVTITATSKANAKATAKCKIKVYKATKKLQLKSQKSYSLNVGKTVALKVTTTPKKGVQPVQWSSKNKKVAKVNSKGKVTAVSAGQTSIIGKSV